MKKTKKNKFELESKLLSVKYEKEGSTNSNENDNREHGLSGWKKLLLIIFVATIITAVIIVIIAVTPLSFDDVVEIFQVWIRILKSLLGG